MTLFFGLSPKGQLLVLSWVGLEKGQALMVLKLRVLGGKREEEEGILNMSSSFIRSKCNVTKKQSDKLCA
jgi:hypothetical protein